MQNTPLSTPAAASPVPLRLTTAVPAVGALDAIVSEPVAAPAVVGSKFTWRFTAFPGFSVTGKPGFDTVNPAPLIVALFTVRGAVPVETTVRNCGVACVLTVTSPKLRLVALTLMAAVPAGCTGLSCRPNVAELVPSLAVMVAVCAVVTAVAVSVKLALLAPPGIATLTGTTAAELLLVSVTVPPPSDSTSLSVTMQLSVPPPVIVLALQDTPVIVGATGDESAPVPLRPTTAVPPAGALEVMVSEPVRLPMLVGSKPTCNAT